MDCNVIIIGAGVVGLSVANTVAKNFDNVFLVDRNNNFGQETSSRNSEVVHSGIYYPTDSLKSKLCVSGRNLLYNYCDARSIPYKKIGKLVIGNKSDGLALLKIIQANASKNGVESTLLDASEISSMEPNVSAEYALCFKESGIVDSHSLMKSLEIDAITNGVTIAYKNEVLSVKKLADGGYVLNIKDSQNNFYDISSNVIVNCGGLNSYNISCMAGICDPRYQLSFWKGEYFWLSNNDSTKVNSLIYPTPEKNITGLGIHTTVDLNGRMKLGPNAIYLGEKNIFDYSVDINNKEKFYSAAKKYLPGLKISQLNADQSGIRPKLQKPGDSFRDFVIENERDRGFENFINLFGIESPGLTSSLAIGNYVNDLINDNLIKG